jgi:hypothetical protein
VRRNLSWRIGNLISCFGCFTPKAVGRTLIPKDAFGRPTCPDPVGARVGPSLFAFLISSF